MNLSLCSESNLLKGLSVTIGYLVSADSFTAHNNEKIAIVNFYPKLRNSILKFKTNMPTSPEGYNQLYGKNLDNSKIECIKKINDTCSIVHLLKEEDDTIIAVLAIN